MNDSAIQDLWSRIEDEKKRDRRIHLISKTAWVVTGLMLLSYGAFVAYFFSQFMSQYDVGMVPFGMVIGALQPIVIVIGSISLLIAVLATIGGFVRQRTATLSEIQVRLAALEATVSKLGNQQ